MLIYGSSQELDVVSKPNLRNQNDVDGLKANDWVKYVEPWMSILGVFHKFFFYYCEIYVNGTHEM